MEKLFLWGEAVKLQIPDNLLAYEASTRGFVGQPLGGKDKILISQHTNRLKHHNPLFPYFKLHDLAPKLCTSILSPYRMPFGNPFLYADKAGRELGGFLSVIPACDVICFSGPCGATLFMFYMSCLTFISFVFPLSSSFTSSSRSFDNCIPYEFMGLHHTTWWLHLLSFFLRNAVNLGG